MFTNWAKESSTLRVSRLMLEVVLNDWVIDTKDTPSPEHHGRADERHGWKGLANNHFSFAAAANVWRGGSGIRANAGDVDQLPDARFSGEPRDSCGSCYMDGMEGLLAALHIETHGVHDALNSRHGSGNGFVTPLRACGPAGGSVATGRRKSAIAATAFRQRSSSRRSGSISGSH
jgi:hypothetical protein